MDGSGYLRFLCAKLDHVEAARLQIDMHQEAVSVALFASGKMIRRTLCSGQGAFPGRAAWRHLLRIAASAYNNRALALPGVQLALDTGGERRDSGAVRVTSLC